MNDEVIEAMAMAYAEAEFADLLYKPLDRPRWIAFHLPGISARIRVALDTLNASGTHWVAPWNATEGMAEALAAISTLDIPIGASDLVYLTVRDAYLSGHRAEGDGHE